MGGAEPDVEFRAARYLIALELQGKVEGVGGLVEAEAGGEGIFVGPCSAGGRGFAGEFGPLAGAWKPLLIAAGEAEIVSIGSEDQGGGFRGWAGFEPDTLHLPVIFRYGVSASEVL